jgi:hypothetical protein
MSYFRSLSQDLHGGPRNPGHNSRSQSSRTQKAAGSQYSTVSLRPHGTASVETHLGMPEFPQ